MPKLKRHKLDQLKNAAHTITNCKHHTNMSPIVLYKPRAEWSVKTSRNAVSLILVNSHKISISHRTTYAHPQWIIAFQEITFANI